MKWNKYRIETTTDAEDFVCGILMELGITGMQIEDNIQISEADRKAMYIDYLAELPEDDGKAYVSFYTFDGDEKEAEESGLFNTGIDIISQEQKISDEELLDEIRKRLLEASTFINIGTGMITKDVTEDKDWSNKWKENFKAFSVAGFDIKPYWEKEESIGERNIYINPGNAFGTGQHETTQLCINELVKYVKTGDKVLDLGCGSGILSMVSKKLGASQLFMTDIDVLAVNSSHENFEINEISEENVEMVCGNVLEDDNLKQRLESEKYDVVVANILADVIIQAVPLINRFLKKDGIFISSGILYTREKEVINAVEKNSSLELVGVAVQGDWRAVIARNRG